jgi:hypothetical protein
MYATKRDWGDLRRMSRTLQISEIMESFILEVTPALSDTSIK